ncbi:MAG TPA: inositol monophosphatase family protein [Chitinophagales bacterium]|nr:inositol monophosphatase family protein [Chitinophagales bacterium]
MNPEKICLEAINIVRAAGKFIAEERKKFSSNEVVNKGQRDLVSYVDVNAEKILVEGLKQILPEAGFLTEEKTIAESNTSLRWIIDPLDGTTNFIHGVPPFSVSIALQQEADIIIGIVYEINLDECFYAWKNGGAFLNGKKISVTQTSSLKDALTATGFPYKEFPLMNRFFATLQFLFNNTHGVRRLGSAAVDLVYVACGRFDGFFEYNLNPWDVAGGALILQEAGGIVTDFNGGANFLFGKEIVASNPNIYHEYLNVVVNPPVNG